MDARDERQLVERLQDLIEAAVRRQMVADVPVGALLSGGVDSTTTATIMSRLADRPIDTFTVGIRRATTISTRPRSRGRPPAGSAVSHHEVVVSADEYAEFLPCRCGTWRSWWPPTRRSPTIRSASWRDDP